MKVFMLASALCLSFFARTSLAHHSALEYDNDATVEIEGEIVSTFWRNPHVRFTVRVTDNGQEVDWEIEGNSLNGLARLGITPDFISVGDQVKVAGPAARNGDSKMRASNVLLADGTEAIFLRGNRPLRWSNQRAGSTGTAVSDAEPDPRAQGIFRMWGNGRGQLLRNVQFPLTDEAKDVQAAWQPGVDEPVTRCVAPGLPMVMSNPYPRTFIDRGDTIELRLEYFDTVRVIDMSNRSVGGPKTLLGYSRGRWDGETLVVETSRVDWPYFNRFGVRLTEAATFEERFTLSEDESRLDYVVTVVDPETFTEPVVLTHFWQWQPEESIRPYECALPEG